MIDSNVLRGAQPGARPYVAIAIAPSKHPNYLDPKAIIAGFMSHFLFTVPLALVVKNRLAPHPAKG